MDATVATSREVSEGVLASLVRCFDIDSGFLRHNDYSLGISTVVAEWPPWGDRTQSDPWAALTFATADPVVTRGLPGNTPAVAAEDSANPTSQPKATNRAQDEPSVLMAPWVAGGVTAGILGLVRSDRKDWTPEQIEVVTAVASLLGRLQNRVAVQERLRKFAEHDDLTGLSNRRTLVEHLSNRLRAGQPGPVAVVFLDADRLKSINDFFGHAVGDWYIQVLAQRLRANLEDTATIARLGGDEFVVVPTEPMTTAEAESLAQRVQVLVNDRLEVGSDLITPTVSIGVVTGTPGTDLCTDLLHRADQAVMAAKHAGGNQVVVASSVTSPQPALRTESHPHLRDDLDSEDLRLYYLPEVDLRTGAIVAIEALVRWQHPVRGLLLPDSFIRAAESTKAGQLGRWVLRTACAEFSRWRSRGIGQNVALRLNVSPVQLVTANFVTSLADTINEFGIDAGSVCLEITERAVVHDIDATRKSLDELKEIGVKIAIDDFGTGYAVLSHLKVLPVDVLKIDTTFVRDLGSDAGDLAIVRAIIGLADAFGLEVVAEGIETPLAAMTLMQHGCHRAQGFLLSRPVPPDAMEALLGARWLPMPYLAASHAWTADTARSQQLERIGLDAALHSSVSPR